MNPIKLFFALSTLGLACMTTIAMQDQEQFEDQAEARTKTAHPNLALQSSESASQQPQQTQTQQSQPDAAPDTSIDPTNTLKMLHRELSEAQKSLKILINQYNPEKHPWIPADTQLDTLLNDIMKKQGKISFFDAPKQKPAAGTVVEPTIERIHKTLLEAQNLVHELTQQYNNNKIRCLISYIASARDKNFEKNIREICQFLATLEIIGSSEIDATSLDTKSKITYDKLSRLISIRTDEIIDAMSRATDPKAAGSLDTLVHNQFKKFGTTQWKECDKHLHKYYKDYDPNIAIEGLIDRIDIPVMQKTIQNLSDLDHRVAKLIGDTKPLIDSHVAHVTTISSTIDALSDYFRKFLHEQEGQTPLDNADHNLVHEINAFLLATKLRLEETKLEINKSVDEFRSIFKEIAATKEILEKLAITKTKIKEQIAQDQSQPPAPAPEPAALQSSTFFQRVTQISTRAATSLFTGAAHALGKGACALADKIYPAFLPLENIPRELGRAQTLFQDALTRLDNTLKHLRSAAATEDKMIRNVRMLCKILDTTDQKKVEKKKQDQKRDPNEEEFHLLHQDEIEQSLAKSMASSTLRILAIKTILEQTKGSKMGSLARFLLKRFSLGKVFPEFPDMLDGAESHTSDKQSAGDMQSDDPQTLDDRYTHCLIKMDKDPHYENYLLYDIAARTRFNTGRFSYLIRPAIYKLELIAGPRREKIDYDKKRQRDATGIRLPPQKRMELPGERYHELMRALADKSTPLEHPWLLFNLPPWIVRFIEQKILLTVTPSLDPLFGNKAVKPVEKALEEPQSAAPLTSTTFRGFIWNALKRIIPARQIGNYVTQTLSTCVNGIKRFADIITGPFINKKPIIAIKNFIGQRWQKCGFWMASAARKMLKQLNNGRTVKNLERNIQEGCPASERLELIQRIAANYHLGWGTKTLQALIAHNHQSIRAFAQRYLKLQHIEPIIPLDPITYEPITKDSTIHDKRLRTELGLLLQGWNAL